MLKQHPEKTCTCKAVMVSMPDADDPIISLVGCANSACSNSIATVVRMQTRSRTMSDRNPRLGGILGRHNRT